MIRLEGYLAPISPIRFRQVRRYLSNYEGLAADNETGTAVIYSWVAANFAGHTKKVTANAVLLM